MRDVLTRSIGFLMLVTMGCNRQESDSKAFRSDQMMIRISEIEIDPAYLEQYKRILKEESEASVRLEPGVISIFPLFQKENPNEIRILEMYADIEAYQAHLQTPHFKHYKTSTLKMVRSLKLIDMAAIDEATIPRIFKKIAI